MFSAKYPNTYLDTYQGFRHYLSQQRARIYVEAKINWLLRTKQAHCVHCGKYLTWKQRKVDHIIPISVIVEKEIWGLWIDDRNFQLLCQPCNEHKSSNLDHLPSSVLSKLGLGGKVLA